MNRAKLLFACLAATGLLIMSAAALAGADPSGHLGPSDQSSTGQRPALARVDRLLADISAAAKPAVAMGKVEALAQLASLVPPSVLADKLEATADEVASPLVQFRLLRAAEHARLNGGDFSNGKDGMDGAVGNQGCLTQWKIVGPFDNPSMQGFRKPLGPENGHSGPYQGKSTAVDWRINPDYDRLCEFDLDAAIEPSTAAVVYLSTQINVDQPGGARLLVGSDGALKAWVNGQPVARRSEDVGMGIDGQAWKVDLKAGDNQLLVKLGSTSDGSLALAARLLNPDLTPMDAMTSTAAWHPRKVHPFGDLPPRPTGQGLASQAEKTAKSTTDADALWAARLWKHVEPLDAATPWRATGTDVLERVEQARAADRPTPVPADDLAVAADLFEQSWQQIDVLELARSLDPSNPWIGSRLASRYGASIAESTQRKQRQVLDDLRAQYPSFLRARLAMANWYASRGFDEKALTTLDTPDDKPLMDVPAYVSRLASLTHQAGRRDRALQLDHTMEHLAALNTGYAWRRTSDLIATTDYGQALGIARAQQALQPWSVRWTIRQAEILRAQNHPQKALEAINSLLKRRPGNTFLYRRKAQILVAVDQNSSAMNAIDQALARKPQDEQLRDFKEFLKPNTNRFYDPWMVDDVRKLAANHPAGSFNYDTLVDQELSRVAPNGLATKVTQRADRVITSEGVDAAKYHRISYQSGDEHVDVLDVKVYKADGSVSEDYDQWSSGGTRKGSTTYNDMARLNLRANNVEVGDIVEFRYRVSQVANENFRGDYFGDVSYVNSTRPIAFARYMVEYPSSWQLYFRAPAIDHTTIDHPPSGGAVANDMQVSGFEMADIAPVETDSGQPGYTDVYDYVAVSNKKTYDEIGHWWWNLTEEQLIVDDAIADKVAELTDGLHSEAKKVQAIHNYVVKNTRYLHVGLGVHGWKPYRTTTCYRNRYGDCKDKASLLKVMLDEAGVPANLVLVRTRRLGAVDRFPALINIFNHAITYVPSMDLYLDGTAEYNGATELTSMDQGAQALVVVDGGDAEMVSLPIDSPADNLLRRTVEVDLSGDEPTARGHLVAHGQNAVYYRRSLEDPRRRDEVFEKQLADVYPDAQLVSATYKHLSDLEKPVEISFEFTGGDLDRSQGDRHVIFPYGAPKHLLSAYAKQASRTQDLTIRLPFENHTTMEYRIDPSRSFEGVPNDTDIKSKFGTVSVDFERRADRLTVDIHYGLSVQRVAAKDYPDFRRFIAEMNAALNETIALRRTPAAE